MRILYYATITHCLLLLIAGFLALFWPLPQDTTPIIVFIVLAAITGMLAPPLRKESNRAAYGIAIFTFLLLIFSGSRFWDSAQPTSYALEIYSREILNQLALLWGFTSFASALLLLLFVYAMFKKRQQYQERALNYRDRPS